MVNWGEDRQMMSEREASVRERRHMGWRDVKLCLVYNLGKSAFLTCH